MGPPARAIAEGPTHDRQWRRRRLGSARLVRPTAGMVGGPACAGLPAAAAARRLGATGAGMGSAVGAGRLDGVRAAGAAAGRHRPAPPAERRRDPRRRLHGDPPLPTDRPRAVRCDSSGAATARPGGRRLDRWVLVAGRHGAERARHRLGHRHRDPQHGPRDFARRNAHPRHRRRGDRPARAAACPVGPVAAVDVASAARGVPGRGAAVARPRRTHRRRRAAVGRAGLHDAGTRPGEADGSTVVATVVAVDDVVVLAGLRHPAARLAHRGGTWRDSRDPGCADRLRALRELARGRRHRRRRRGGDPPRVVPRQHHHAAVHRRRDRPALHRLPDAH